MAVSKIDLWIYAHWKGMAKPQCIGIYLPNGVKGVGYLVSLMIEIG